MMNDEDYVWYTDEKGKLRSVGYPIENIFKEADIPAIMGGHNIFSVNSADSASLAIPAGLVYMHSLTSKEPNIQGAAEAQAETVSSDMSPTTMAMLLAVRHCHWRSNSRYAKSPTWHIRCVG